MSNTIYRGYEIAKCHDGFWIYMDGKRRHDEPCKSETQAMDQIDVWKREAAQAKANA